MEKPTEEANPSEIGHLGIMPGAGKAPQMAGSNAWKIPLAFNNSRYGSGGDTSLFSSSLPVLPHEKSNYADSGHGTPSMDDVADKLKNQMRDDMDIKDSKMMNGGLDLPDDEDELLAGIIDDFEPIEGGVQGGQEAEELEEYDVFGTGGGLELDLDLDLDSSSDPAESITIGLARASIIGGGDAAFNINGGALQYGLPNAAGVGVGGTTVAGEHPYGEHPSRTLFVRNINSNVEDSELRSLFEQYGDIRTLYTATKHRGFVMISYYDIRDARTAMRALQNKPLRRRKLDIHFSIPKDNPSDKDLNQGTLVIFNLDPSVSNDELRQIFGAYGEVKEIRETPHKRHHKFIEFYDVRAAEAALRALNKSEIAGKRIKLEPSRPGGARRNLVQQLTHELEQDDPRIYKHHQVGSPIANSPPGAWAQYSSPTESNLLQAFSNNSGKSPSGGGGRGVLSPIGTPNHHHFPGPGLGLSLSSLPGPAGAAAAGLISSSSPVKMAPIGIAIAAKDNNHNRSFPEYSSSIDAATATAAAMNNSSSSPGTLTGPQFLWGSPKPYSEHSQSSSSWHSPPPVGPSFPSNSNINHYTQGQGPSFYGGGHQHHHHHHHHMGSAPSGVPFETHFGFLPESPDASSFVSPAKYGSSIGAGRNSAGALFMNLSPFDSINSPKYNRMMPPSQRLGPATLFGSSPYAGGATLPMGLELLIERARARKAESSASQLDSKKQYQLDLDKIITGEDARTTLMIKNIPNKYTSKMLLAAIDENHKGTYDFFYLPIDFKNKCNVGYAFINMISPTHIVSFYEAFNGKKWEKFNSEKVASLAYARIQGRAALISHFQNSSLLNEDKRCRPILFHSDGPHVGNQEPFPLNGMMNMPMPLQQEQEEMGAGEEEWPDLISSTTKANHFHHHPVAAAAAAAADVEPEDLSLPLSAGLL